MEEYLIEEYRDLLMGAFATIECCEDDWTYPRYLYWADLVCEDGTEVKLDLISEDQEYYFWVKYSGEFFEEHLCPIPNHIYSWFKDMNAVEAHAVEIMQRIVKGGKEYLEYRISIEGISPVRSLIITDKRMDSIIKLPVSCAIVAFGQVFHGVKELEEYCTTQGENSSPYVLKRSLLYSDKNDYGQMDTRFCRNYLICSNKASAVMWMRDFIALGRVSAMSPETIRTPKGFPPLACYADGCRYMILSYH